MSTSPKPPTRSQLVMTLQIIVFSMASGLVFFAVVATVVSSTGDEQPDPDAAHPFLSYGAYLLLAAAIGGALVVPRLIVSGQVRQLAKHEKSKDELQGALLSLYLTKTIIGVGILEGAGFFALICYMLEETFIPVPAAALAMLGILLHFPTASGIETWIERRVRAIDEQRMLYP